MLDLNTIMNMPRLFNNEIDLTKITQSFSVTPLKVNTLSTKNYKDMKTYTFENIRIGLDTCNFKRISNIFEGNIFDIMLEAIGNTNRSKKKNLIRRTTCDKIEEIKIDYENNVIYCNNNDEIYENNAIFDGFNKTDNVVVQQKVSYDKTKPNFICNFKNIYYELKTIGISKEQKKMAKKLKTFTGMHKRLNDKTKEKIKCLLGNCYNINKDMLEEIINCYDLDQEVDEHTKEFLWKIPNWYGNTMLEILCTLINNTKTKYGTGLSKVCTIDVDLDNSLLDILKLNAVFNICSDFKCFIARNKNKEKRNHITIVFLLENLTDLKTIKQIRNKFKIAGICDVGHNTVGGKNIFNLNEFDVYVNTNGSYINNESKIKMVDESINNEIAIFKNYDIKINNLDELYERLFINKYKNKMKVKNLEFTNTSSFAKFASKYCNVIENDLDENEEEIVVMSKNNKPLEEEHCKGLNDFFINLRDNEIKFKDIYKYNIVLKDYDRQKNCYRFGWILGSNLKFSNMKEKDAIKIFNTIVKVEEPDNKHSKEKLLENMLNGFRGGRNKISDMLDFKSIQSIRGTAGNFVSNTNRTTKVIVNIINHFVNCIKDNTNINKAKKMIKHRNYNELIDKIADELYYCNTVNIDELISKIMFIAKEWLNNRTMNNIKEACFYKGITKKKIIEMENEAINNLEKEINNIEFKIIINKIKKVISKHISGLDLDVACLISTFKNNIRTLLTRKRYCLVE